MVPQPPYGGSVPGGAQLCVRAALLLFAGALAYGQQNASTFDFDASRLPELQCESISPRADASLRGCSFAGPHGGRVNLVLVNPPASVRPPYAGVIYQHGGGQSMSNYVSEALVLARRGVVSMLTDAPARGNGVDSENRFAADVVVSLRMALEHLLQQPGVDARRIGYVGHSYGGVAGGTLSGIEPRIRVFALLGATASESGHTDGDPSRFLRQAKAPVLVQCASWDTDDNRTGCPVVHALAGGPKKLVWYDDDHNFTSWEAARDRLGWLGQHLGVRGVAPAVQRFWAERR